MPKYAPEATLNPLYCIIRYLLYSHLSISQCMTTHHLPSNQLQLPSVYSLTQNAGVTICILKIFPFDLYSTVQNHCSRILSTEKSIAITLVYPTSLQYQHFRPGTFLNSPCLLEPLSYLFSYFYVTFFSPFKEKETGLFHLIGKSKVALAAGTLSNRNIT